MTWTYSGNPGASDKDKYRFLVGDTNEDQPILQDEEIQFIIDEHSNHYTRLFHLFDKAATFFSREITTALGPIEEDPVERRNYFIRQANYYKSVNAASGISKPKSTEALFKKGMHDNV